VKHLSDAPLKGRLLALPTDIRLGWKGLPGINALAYYEKSSHTAVKVLEHWPQIDGDGEGDEDGEDELHRV
jgi:hypothetical protein